MVSFQELYEFATALIDIASGDVEAAKVLSENRLLDKALYFIERGSEKITKASFLSTCLCFHGFSDEAVSRCYQNIARDREGNVRDPKDFVKIIGHNFLNLLKLLKPNVPSSRVLKNMYRHTILELAKKFESALREICSLNILKNSKLCKSDIKSLKEEIKKCKKTRNMNVCSDIMNKMNNVSGLLSEFLLVKDLWKQLGIRKLLEILYDMFQELHSLRNESIKKVMRKVELTSSTESVQVVKQKIRFMVECIVSVIIPFLVAYTLFYLTSPLYNYIRYPDSPEKLNMCKDEALVKIEAVKNICSKKFIGPGDVVADETYVKMFVEKAVENLKSAISVLKEVLSSVKTLHSM